MKNTEFKKYARQLSEISGRIINQYFRTGLTADIKSDLSPVTIADKLAEEKMREAIMKDFPDHGIIGEEFGSHNETAEYKWILDPIDGTKSFISGVPLFGTLIALTKNNKPILGVINFPVLNQFLCGDNNLTELNGNVVKVKSGGSLSEAVLLTTDHMHIAMHKNINKFNLLLEKVRLYRTWGDCYGYFLVATGSADIMIDPVMSVWDIMALVPVIRGAGGIITSYSGEDPLNAKDIIAAVPDLHQKIILMLNE